MKQSEGAICTVCSESCALHLYDDHYENEGLTDVSIMGGYPSTPGNGLGALDDATRYTFSICEFCLDFLFENARVPPTTCHPGRDAIEFGDRRLPAVPDEVFPFACASERVARDDWRTRKAEFYAERDRRAALRKIRSKS